MVNNEYHKGEFCPHNGTFCQEGYCSGCEIEKRFREQGDPDKLEKLMENKQNDIPEREK